MSEPTVSVIFCPHCLWTSTWRPPIWLGDRLPKSDADRILAGHIQRMHPEETAVSLYDRLVPAEALRWGRNPETLEWHQARLGYMASRMADRYAGCFADDLQALMDAFADLGNDGHMQPHHPRPWLPWLPWRKRR